MNRDILTFRKTEDEKYAEAQIITSSLISHNFIVPINQNYYTLPNRRFIGFEMSSKIVNIYNAITGTTITKELPEIKIHEGDFLYQKEHPMRNGELLVYTLSRNNEHKDTYTYHIRITNDNNIQVINSFLTNDDYNFDNIGNIYIKKPEYERSASAWDEYDIKLYIIEEKKELIHELTHPLHVSVEYELIKMRDGTKAYIIQTDNECFIKMNDVIYNLNADDITFSNYKIYGYELYYILNRDELYRMQLDGKMQSEKIFTVPGGIDVSATIISVSDISILMGIPYAVDKYLLLDLIDGNNYEIISTIPPLVSDELYKIRAKEILQGKYGKNLGGVMGEYM